MKDLPLLIVDLHKPRNGGGGGGGVNSYKKDGAMRGKVYKEPLRVTKTHWINISIWATAHPPLP